jgi:hypothetical protein
MHVRVTGTNSARAVFDYLAEMSAECAHRQCGRLLVEENLQGPGLSMGQVFEIVSTRGHQVSPTVRAIAYVDTNPEHNAGTMSFAEDVAVNRGMNLRVFSSVRDAASWLVSMKNG